MSSKRGGVTDDDGTAEIGQVPAEDVTGLGAPSNYKDLRAEPADHGVGRSRGGLSTKIHHLVDGHGMPLAILTAPGQAGAAPIFPILMGHLQVGRRAHPAASL
ncbi:hypothetical protein M2272_004012 [Mycobacterium frederiksbergense]|uniref:Transposase IS4-like domain-containing protein n=1 Tax=Mycolicibacterium frederiksbergense TaxID=117567 RepID=A0ABT6L366_9MYCO|nr:hypothetical protein [Mycolicibacterium frederiksbergense]